MFTINITLEQIGVIISFFTSIAAIIISLITYRFHRRELFTKYITTQRVLHIEDYRNNLFDFLEACINNNYKVARISSIKLKLLFSPVNYLHRDMSDLLDDSLNRLLKGEKIDLQPLLVKMQTIIKNEWEQMKIESGSKKFTANSIHDWDRYKKEKQF